MNARRDYHTKSTHRQAKRRNVDVTARASNRGKERVRARRSTLIIPNRREPFAPPEDWHEPKGRDDYRVVVQTPGPGYRHVVTPAEVRDRLSRVPEQFLEELEVVQFSRITRKKQSFPCYGMQWGSALYLYPLEESLIEYFYYPPKPSMINEAKMYGGRWDSSRTGMWRLIWTEQSAKDFYLNNILIHELGHLVDGRNSTYLDRERYAEWFAIEFGYRQSGGRAARQARTDVRKRHHRR
jgi:hypothetical protein